MTPTWNLANGVAAAVVVSTTALIFGPTAAADPVTQPLPMPAAQLPGLPAMEKLSPIIQQAAADPEGAVSLLMAAAAAFTGNPAQPAGSQQVANSVTEFVQSPAAPVSVASAHVPAPGVVPGTVAHLPTGIDPAHVVGPAFAASSPAAAPEAAPAPDAAPAPEAAPAPLADGAPAPAPEATSGFGPGSPTTQDFMYPSIGNGCLSDGGNSIAAALSVAGPATIPAPGPGPGQTAYVFTAIGTPGPADVQKLPLNVTWVNLTTGKSGGATLQPRADINPDGPTTLTAIADTGPGSVISTIFGQVSTKDKQCQFLPTIGSTVVP